MDEVEFPAERGDLVRFPRAARFPAEQKLAAFGTLKKAFHTGNVFRGGAEAGWTLEKDAKCAEFFCHSKCFVPRPTDCGIKSEVATLLPVMIVKPGTLVGGATGTMCDDLPSF